MTEEFYKKARELNEDIYSLKKCLWEVQKKRHWVTLVTPNIKEVDISSRLQDELVEWLETKQEEYQKEFDELGCE